LDFIQSKRFRSASFSFLEGSNPETNSLFSMTSEREAGPVEFIMGDAENAVELVENNKFELILCIEATHCFTNFE